MRTRHTAHSFSAFPVYSSTFLSNDLLVLGGGGGSGKSGIKNRIVRGKHYRQCVARVLNPIPAIIQGYPR